MYEMQDSELMNSDKPQSKDSNEEKLAMMLKYEEVTPELIPFKMQTRSIFMYNNNFKKWMNKLVNVQRDMLILNKEGDKYDSMVNDSPKKNVGRVIDIN